MTYCYSTDEERFCGDFATIGEARSAAEEALSYDHEPGTECVYWVAETKPAIEYLRKASLRLGKMIQEHVEEWLADDIAWDDEIVELSDEHRAGLGAVVLDYLEKRAKFNTYGVQNAQQFEYVVEAA